MYLRSAFGKPDLANLYNFHNETSKKRRKNRRKNEEFLAFPLGVWEDEFSVVKPFCSGAGEKETQTLKVVWGKNVSFAFCTFSKFLGLITVFKMFSNIFA